MFRYISEKIFVNGSSNNEAMIQKESEFSTVKFVAIAGSISLVLFGLGYTLYGLGSSLNSTAKILDEMNDSNDSSESVSDSSRDFIDTSDIEISEISLDSD